MLGKNGVQKATAYAILNANYLMKKLSKYYPILNNK
jgi:glycine cleavage system protein P-like pyridoxal-binding family